MVSLINYVEDYSHYTTTWEISSIWLAKGSGISA